MQLQEAIDLIWQNKKYETNSETEAISHLNEEVAESLKALLKNDKKLAVKELEDAFSCMLIAFKVLDINPDEVIKRQIDKMQNDPQRMMHIFSNRVEIRIGDEVKGKWSAWTYEEFQEAISMAKEFKCLVFWEEENQFKEALTSGAN